MRPLRASTSSSSGLPSVKVAFSPEHSELWSAEALWMIRKILSISFFYLILYLF
ncbi:hypothetical protein X975_24522, partial [Stegodyphus mimosarum]